MKNSDVCFCAACFALMLTVVSSTSWAKVIDRLVVSINKDDVSLDETFNYIVSANGVAERKDLDTSALTNDFEIIELKFDKYSYQVNRQLSNSSSWIIKLKPKRIGELVIPPVTLGIAASSEEYIDVSETDASIADKPAIVRIESSLSENQAIVGQDLLYTITVYQDVEVVRRRIYQSFPEQIQATQLGNDDYVIEYQAGQPVQFSRRRYKLTATADADFDIPPPIFTGIARTRNQGNFGRIFATEEDVSVNGEPTRLRISPAPDDAQQINLFANDVSMAAKWQSPTFKSGDANLLTLQLKATGSDMDKLPDLVVDWPQTLRAYPETVKRQQSVENDVLVSTLTATIAVVPSISGQISIPDISVDWYNLTNQTTDKTTLDIGVIDVQETVTVVSSQTTVAPWYTDFRLYLAACILIALIYAFHIRWLTKQIMQSNQASTEPTTPLAMSLSRVITTRHSAELPSALKTWLDENLGKQPSITHHQRSEKLRKLAPDLCALINQFFERYYYNGYNGHKNTAPTDEVGNGDGVVDIDDAFFNALSKAISDCKAALQSQKQQPLTKTETYLY